LSLFNTSINAWHDALMTKDGVQDPFTPKITSTKPGSFSETYDASLSKINRKIDGLKKPARDAGNWCYGPESIAVKERICQMLYTRYQQRNGDQFTKRCVQTTKVLIMVNSAAADLRFRACADGDRNLSHNQVAIRMGIDRSSFSKTWADGYEDMIDHVWALARDGLTEVEVLVNQMNVEHQRAG